MRERSIEHNNSTLFCKQRSLPQQLSWCMLSSVLHEVQGDMIHHAMSHMLTSTIVFLLNELHAASEGKHSMEMHCLRHEHCFAAAQKLLQPSTAMPAKIAKHSAAGELSCSTLLSGCHWHAVHEPS